MNLTIVTPTIKHKLKHNEKRALTTIKMAIFALITGVILGIIGTLFCKGIRYATFLRLNHPLFLLLLPIGAVLIRFLYHLFKGDKDTGTNLVLDAIHTSDDLPLRMTPLIFISTIFTHLCGGSAGREGAALQIGGSVGSYLGRLLHFNDANSHIMIMCGMSGAFSAIFGTPMAAAVFSMEVVSVGIMHYAALVPCVISSFAARATASWLGIPSSHYSIGKFEPFSITTSLKISILAVLCGLVSILFCICLQKTDFFSRKWMPNIYIRAAVNGLLVLLLTLLCGSQDYNGTGLDIIRSCLDGKAVWYAFLLKILFTSLTLSAGYKGGEIVPSFYIGASFGCAMGFCLGLSPALCAAVGMGAIFCGVTNSPLTALLICLELFGMTGMPYFFLAIAISYMVSGYYGVYTSQKIVYSKFRSNYIDKKTE